MGKDWKVYIKKLLEESPELKPIETGVKPSYTKDESIKAVVFDIYGTLLISASGDIDQSEVSTENLEYALRASGIQIKDCSKDKKEAELKRIISLFPEVVKHHHSLLRAKGLEYPEINITEVWQEVLEKEKTEIIACKFEEDKSDIELMSFIFEVLSNRVYPMPGMKDILTSLKGKNYPLGIVSNAQFYTPITLNYFLSGQIKEIEFADGFNSDISIFSYKESRAKPDTSIFYDLAGIFNLNYGLMPKDILFVGNDMLKDIYTASHAGFKTALFAGDLRSLRWREGHKLVNGVSPDHIITDLNQLNEIVK